MSGAFQNSSDDLLRYHRQMLLPDFGLAGQRKLGARAALIVGCGALGCTVAEQLARAGVGRLIIVDRDVVELTNLQRQTLFDEQDAALGTPKAIAAAQRLNRINSTIRITPIVADVTPGNAEALLRVHAADSIALEPGTRESARFVEVVVDCTDNFQTRYLINDACVKHHVPLVYAGVVGMSGTLMTIRPGVGPCLRCVFPDLPEPGTAPTCDTAGVLGPLVGMAASMQSVEAIKVLLGREDLCNTSLIAIAPWDNRFREFNLSNARRQSNDDPCPCCVRRQFEHLDSASPDSATLCGANAVQIAPGQAAARHLDLADVARRLSPHGSFIATPHLVRGTFFRERGPLGETPISLTVFPDARAIVGGTTDVTQARSILARYLGA